MAGVHGLNIAEFSDWVESTSLDDFKRRFTVPFLVVERKAQNRSSQVFQTVAPREEGGDEAPPLQDDTVSAATDNVSAAQEAGGDELFVFTLEKTQRNSFANMITVGRSTNNDVILNHPAVSKLHAFFRLDGEMGEYTVTDVGSTNRTFMDEKPLEPNSAEYVPSRKTLLFGGAVKATFFLPPDFYEYLQVYRRLNG